MKIDEEQAKDELTQQGSSIELTSGVQGADRQPTHQKMATARFDDQTVELDAGREISLSSTGATNQLPRPRIARSRRPASPGRKVSKVKNGSVFKLVLLRLIWTSCKVIGSSLAVYRFAAIMMIINLISPMMSITKCDDELNAQLSNLLNDNSDKSHKSEFYDIIQNQRDGRSQDDMDNGEDGAQSDELPDQAMSQPGNGLQSSQNEANYNQQKADDQQQSSQANENRANESSASEQLDTAQTNSQSNSVSAAASEQKSNQQQDSGTAATSDANNQAPNVASSASTTASLSDHLNAVNKLIQQAGQLGLSAAQQNVALSEAIINSVTNSLSGSAAANRRPANQVSSGSPSATPTVSSLPPNAAQGNRPGAGGHVNLVGQSTIDGNINYDPNSSTLNGFIEFPNFPNLGNLTNSLPSLNGAVKPLLMAAIKTAPVKIGSVTWKLLKLLAWKKIYKAHHPKSGEIIIEQEVKPTTSHIMGDSKGSKIKDKFNDHFEGKFRGSKMGHGSFSNDDWMTMMRATGPGGFHGSGGDMFLGGVGGGGSGGGWPHGDSQASASMVYQRHLLPGPATTSVTSGAGQQQAAAVAAAAAATAAAIQSHWSQQQQQQMMAEEVGESKTNQTNARRRSKPSYGGGNWFAANPAHAYAAAAAAANAAAAMASQQQQQQRLFNMMRAYDSQNHYQSSDMIHGDNNVNSGLQHALATGMMYQSLFDNAASMAVQNVVKLPPTHHNHHMNHLGGDDFMDQSDSLSGSPLGSLTHTSLGGSPENLPMGLMQRHDSNQPREQHMEASPSDNLAAGRSPSDNLMALSDYPTSRDSQTQSMLHRSNSFSESVADFDDTPAGKILNNPINFGSYYSSRRMD